MAKIYFCSGNEEKFNEMSKIFDINGLQLEWYNKKIQELQATEGIELIKAKALEAYKEIRRPILVEHTVLEISAFNELPGLQTDYFYSNLGCEKIVEYCRFKSNYKAKASSFLCFCNGKNFYVAKGEEKGIISDKVDNNVSGFAWDKIFIPTNDNPDHLTYAEWKKLKNNNSMRKRAWVNLKKKCSEEVLALNEMIDDDQDMRELAELIKAKKVLLFVGAGISASLEFPSWNKLIGDIGEQLGYDSKLFKIHGDYMMLAEYAGLKQENLPYNYITEKFSLDDKADIKDKLKKSDIYDCIKELDFPVIYTTNYDHLIEEYYGERGSECYQIISIDDMGKIARADNLRGPIVVKFHGDITNEETIVLSESQYFERMDFQSFLDVMLQADILKYHILFLGYSMSDINIKLLLYLARKRWKNNDKLMKAYIFTATPNEIQKEVFRENGIITFSGDEADKEKGTLDFLKRLCSCVNTNN